jgi:aminoglycoside 3-N-acetyltransferase
VQGGAETVVDVLMKAVGEAGNLLMPAFAHHTFSKYYMDTNPIFDIKNSPSRAGAVTEVFRKKKGVKRSFHPTDSVCAYGPLAGYFTEGHFGQLTPYNAFSPYCRLTEKKGKILNIGVPLNTSCTNMHTLEDAVDFKFPVYHEKIYDARMIDENGKMRTMKTKVHDPVFSQKRRPDEQIPMFEKDGALTWGRFGEADVMLVDAVKLFDSMLKNYKEKGVTMYTPIGS